MEKTRRAAQTFPASPPVSPALTGDPYAQPSLLKWTEKGGGGRERMWSQYSSTPSAGTGRGHGPGVPLRRPPSPASSSWPHPGRAAWSGEFRGSALWQQQRGWFLDFRSHKLHGGGKHRDRYRRSEAEKWRRREELQGREDRGEGWRKPEVKMEGDMEGERRRPRRRMSTRSLRDRRKVEAQGRGFGLVPLRWSSPGELS